MPTKSFQNITQSADFDAYHRAVKFLTDRGFSVGPMQANSPTGVMFGQWDVSKWRNLSKVQQQACDAVITAGNFRHGPVTVTMREHASQEATIAFNGKPATTRR